MADRFRSLKTAGELSEGQLVQVERDVFIGFYSARKLIETITKVTDATKDLGVPVKWHPNVAPVNWRNNHKLDELYDLNVIRGEVRDIKFVCGRIIHSFIFTPCQGEEGLYGVFFTSDTDKNSKLYFLSADQIVDIFESVGNDDPAEIHWSEDEQSGKETTIVR
jgi:hypothetical protein